MTTQELLMQAGFWVLAYIALHWLAQQIAAQVHQEWRAYKCGKDSH